MSLFEQFATDPQREKEGIDITISPNPDGTVPTITVARTFRESAEYRKVFERVTKPHKFDIDHNRLDSETDILLMQRVFAEVSVKGWKNIRLPKGIGGIGKGEGDAYVDNRSEDSRALSLDDFRAANGRLYDIEFSLANVIALFAIPQLRDVYKECALRSADADQFRLAELEAMAKNS